MKTVMKTFMVETTRGILLAQSSLRNIRSERHGAECPTKDQLTGFMVGTVKGFIVNDAGFAGSALVLAVSARAAAKHLIWGFMVGSMNPFMVQTGGLHGGAEWG
jgi:Mg/Co/Ni transporter MgtE